MSTMIKSVKPSLHDVKKQRVEKNFYKSYCAVVVVDGRVLPAIRINLYQTKQSVSCVVWFASGRAAATRTGFDRELNSIIDALEMAGVELELYPAEESHLYLLLAQLAKLLHPTATDVYTDRAVG